MLSSSLYRVPSVPASGRGLCQSHLPWGNALAMVSNLQLTSRQLPTLRPDWPGHTGLLLVLGVILCQPPDRLPVQPHPGLCWPPRLPLGSTSQAPQGARHLCCAGGGGALPQPCRGCGSWHRPPRGVPLWPCPRPCVSFHTFFSAGNPGHITPQLHSCSPSTSAHAPHAGPPAGAGGQGQAGVQERDLPQGCLLMEVAAEALGVGRGGNQGA